MKATIFLTTLLLCTSLCFAQNGEDLHDEFNCGFVPETGNLTTLVGSSSNGYFFTPKKDLRVLVIYVKFIGDLDGDGKDEVLGGTFHNWDPNKPFPEDHIGSNQEILYGHDTFSDFGTLGNPPADANMNLSEYFYHMSQGEMRLYFETLKDVNGVAANIIIDPIDPNNPGTYLSSGEIELMVIDKIQSDFSHMDWSRFDIQKSSPQFQNDHSGTFQNPNSDNRIDATLIVYRSGNSEPRIINFQGSGSISSKSYQMDSEGTYSASAWIRNNTSWFRPRGFIARQIHELGHGFFYAPHIAGANGVAGHNFYVGMGESMMRGHGVVTSTMNAWERWASGWMDITYDLDETLSGTQTFTLKGYLDDNEVMRLKLPHFDNQHLWLEYQENNTNPFYEIEIFNQDRLGNPIPEAGSGLYGFVESIVSDRNDVTVNKIFGRGANGYKPIYSRGNHDYEFDSFYQAPYLWPNSPASLRVNRLDENPFGGHHEASLFRFDFDPEDGEIYYTSGANSGGDNEQHEIMEVNDTAVWGERAPFLPLEYKKLSAFTNPGITNALEYNKSQNIMAPVFLHSLSVTPGVPSNGEIDITVNYNDGHIENNFRMTGHIYLPENEDITLDPHRVLTLNRTKTPNVNQLLTDGTFFNYTAFIAAENGSFTADHESNVILDESSTMIFSGGSTLNMNDASIIYIRNGSLLCIKENAIVNLHSLARIVVEDGFLNVHPSIDISANVTYTNDYTGNPQIFQTLDYCGVNSPEHLHSIQGTNVSGSTCAFNPNVIVNNEDIVKLTSETFVEINPGFEVIEGGNFEAEIMAIANDCDIEFWFGDSGNPSPISSSSEKRNASKSTVSFEISVVPNPSNGLFEVMTKNAIGAMTYELYNFSGHRLLTGNVASGIEHFKIDGRGLEAGIYILKVINNKNSVSSKVIIQ